LQVVLANRLSWVNQTLADDVRVEEKGEEGYYDWESDVRQLGAGSFGTVELYTRKDSNGNPVDVSFPSTRYRAFIVADTDNI